MKELVSIQSELKAPKGQKNNFGNYKYRSCEDILEALKPLLKKHECFLTIEDEIVQVADRIYVKATASINKVLDVTKAKTVKVSAYAREPLNKKGMDEAQVTGATSSYARKYALNGLFAIDDTKDSDFTNKHGKDKQETTVKPKVSVKQPETLVKRISVKDRNALIKKVQDKDMSLDDIKKILSEFKFNSTTEVTVDKYEDVKKAVDNYGIDFAFGKNKS